MNTIRTLSVTLALSLACVDARDACSRQRPLPPEGQAALDLHPRAAQRPQGRAAVRRQARLRRGEEGLHRRAALQADHGRRGPRRLGHGELPVAALRPGLPEHPPVAAAPGRAQHELGPLRGGSGPHLPGARLRPRQHQLHQGRHRLDRLRPADRRGDRAGRAPADQREAGQAPGRRRRLLAFARGPLGRRARRRGRGGRGQRQGHADRARGLHGTGDRRERVRRQRHVAAQPGAVRHAAAAQSRSATWTSRSARTSPAARSG